MTREDLIQAILQEKVSASEGPDWGTGISTQEFAFQNMVQNLINKGKKRKLKEEEKKRVIHVSDLPDARKPPPLQHYRKLRDQSKNSRGLLAYYRTLAKQAAQVSEGEDKWLRMKQHIASNAREQGLTGKQMNAYVYGAMRKRGWKPQRELDETMSEFHRVGSKVVKKVHKSFNRNVMRPYRGVRRAQRYHKEALVQFGQGNWDRALTMQKRARKVMTAHAPALVGAGVGAASGLVGLPVPGGMEMGAVVGAKTGRVMNTVAVARRVRKAKVGEQDAL